MLRFSKIPVICWDISYQQCSQVRKDCVGHQMVEWCYIIVKAAMTLSQGWWAIKKQSAAVPGFHSIIHMWVVVFFLFVDQAELMSGFIEFCVELKSVSEGAAAAEVDGEVAQQSTGDRNGRGGRRGMLHRQNSVVCSRVHTLSTINYVDNGESLSYRRWRNVSLHHFF